MTEDTLFQKIIKREIPAEIVYEDKDFIAILDINPVNQGHTLLIPKEPFKDIFEMTDESLSKVGPLLKMLAKAIEKSLKPAGINIGFNNGSGAGQLILHAHFHIMPRFVGDGYELWHGEAYKEGEASKVAEKIRNSISK